MGEDRGWWVDQGILKRTELLGLPLHLHPRVDEVKSQHTTMKQLSTCISSVCVLLCFIIQLILGNHSDTRIHDDIQIQMNHINLPTKFTPDVIPNTNTINTVPPKSRSSFEWKYLISLFYPVFGIPDVEFSQTTRITRAS